MSSKAGSTFVTFLMSIPFAAVGLMAIFGVPPLSSVIAASRGINDKIQEFGEDDRSSRRSDDNGFEEWDSESAPSWDEDKADQGTQETDLSELDESDREIDDLGFTKIRRGEKVSDAPGAKKNKSRKRIDEFAAKDDLKSSDTNDFHDTSKTDAAREFNQHGSAPLVSMKESLKKLHSLGVKHYHMERSADQDTWLFVCLFSPGDDKRVTHRFEAESEDPDHAVAETVKQIDIWLLKRFRDMQSISQNAR